MGLGKTTRWNAHELPAYDRLKFYRAARDEARAMQQKMSSMAGNFSSIQMNQAVEMGNIISRVALKRVSDTAQAAKAATQEKFSKLA